MRLIDSNVQWVRKRMIRYRRVPLLGEGRIMHLLSASDGVWENVGQLVCGRMGEWEKERMG